MTVGEQLPPVADDATTLKVLDVGTLVAGPFAATLLADLGAEVLKVEPPGKGDFIRGVGEYATIPGSSPQWQVHGRGKRSITLDLRQPEGQELFRRLVQWADLLIENMRPGTLDKWGLGYENLSAVNPRLVYLSVSGWGQDGPYRNRPSYEFAAAAFGGLTYLTGFADRPPVLPGLAVIDHITAMFGLIGALEAVRRRDALGPQGKGCHLDVALYEPAIRISNDVLGLYADREVLWQREGSIPSGTEAPHYVYGYIYETRDGRFIACYPTNRAQFEGLVGIMGRPELLTDPRFDTEHRRKYVEFLAFDAILRQWVSEHDFDFVMEQFKVAGAAYGPVNGPAEILTDDHVIARENLVQLDDGEGGHTTVPAPLPKIDGQRPQVRWPAQKLGASNQQVFGDLLGLSSDEIKKLEHKGII
jgi:crotonobetainyl-CoA:carnitine CoA-transferase CaiB-like acyl-CoA transferase